MQYQQQFFNRLEIPDKHTSVVQLVECWSPKPEVGGSSPSGRANAQVAEWSKAVASNPTSLVFRGFESYLACNEAVVKIAGTNHMSTQGPNSHRQQPRAEMYPRAISVSDSSPLQKVSFN